MINNETLNHLAELTEGFGGAELEQIVIMGLFDAFAEDRSIEMKDFENSIRNTVPLSVTQAEQIRSIRDWADIRAVAATAREDRIEYDNASESKPSPPDDKVIDKSIINDSQSDINESRGGRTLDF